MECIKMIQLAADLYNSKIYDNLLNNIEDIKNQYDVNIDNEVIRSIIYKTQFNINLYNIIKSDIDNFNNNVNQSIKNNINLFNTIINKFKEWVNNKNDSNKDFLFICDLTSINNNNEEEEYIIGEWLNINDTNFTYRIIIKEIERMGYLPFFYLYKQDLNKILFTIKCKYIKKEIDNINDDDEGNDINSLKKSVDIIIDNTINLITEKNYNDDINLDINEKEKIYKVRICQTCYETKRCYSGHRHCPNCCRKKTKLNKKINKELDELNSLKKINKKKQKELDKFHSLKRKYEDINNNNNNTKIQKLNLLNRDDKIKSREEGKKENDTFDNYILKKIDIFKIDVNDDDYNNSNTNDKIIKEINNESIEEEEVVRGIKRRYIPGEYKCSYPECNQIYIYSTGLNKHYRTKHKHNIYIDK
jgi:hypothetical protein